MVTAIATRLDIRGLTVELPTESGWVRPVNDVSFSLAEGETLGIVGESGSGKTMLSLALMGLEPPGARRSGEAWLETRDGERVNLVTAAREELRKMRGRDIAMIFQEPMTALDPVMRIGAQVEEAIRVHEPSVSASEVARRAHRGVEARDCAGAGAACAPVSASAFGRLAATRDDRDGPRAWSSDFNCG